MRNLSDNPRYLVWKVPGTSNQDSPPPYSEHPNGPSVPNEDGHNETTGNNLIVEIIVVIIYYAFPRFAYSFCPPAHGDTRR